ncbi:MAG: DUF1501 domain-containing protein [Bryobacterales bacterium]
MEALRRGCAQTWNLCAGTCLVARRLAERGVRFIQLFWGWDQHTKLPRDIRQQCADTDQASAALVQDLKQRGMLDDTLVVWGGEFPAAPSTAKQDDRGRLRSRQPSPALLRSGWPAAA